MNAAYGVLCLISFLMIIIYRKNVHSQSKTILAIFIFVFIANLGYLILSASSSLQMALMGNRIAYFGSAFLLYAFLLAIIEKCKLKTNKTINIVLCVISSAAFLLAASGGIPGLTGYYKSVTLENINGTFMLVKEYGSLHVLYTVYLLLYIALMTVCIIHSIIKNDKTVQKEAILFLVIDLGAALVWFVEQFTTQDFEFLSLMYVVGEIILVIVYCLLEEYENKLTKLQESSNEKSSVKKYQINEEEIDALLKKACEDCTLTKREVEVLKLLLLNKKRKDIAEELFVTENTVKKHTSHIYEKYEVSNRNELFEKIVELAE